MTPSNAAQAQITTSVAITSVSVHDELARRRQIRALRKLLERAAQLEAQKASDDVVR